MKPLLTKLSYAFCIAIAFSLNAYLGKAAFNEAFSAKAQGEEAQASQESQVDGSDPLPQLDISIPAAFIRMNGGTSKSIQYTFVETGSGAGLVTSVTYRFYTQYGGPLGEARGPYPARIEINSLQSTEWKGQVSLPESVITAAREMDEYAIVLEAEFNGETQLGNDFSAETSLLLLLSPEAFNKRSPADGSVDQPTTVTLQWDSSVGAVDYEYCFDTVENTKCETGWQGTYDTQVTLQDLPPATTFYWHVRANNLSGKTASDHGAWWSFTTGGVCLGDMVTVRNTNDSYGPGSLRQAIEEVCPGGTIVFDPSLSGLTIFPSSTLILQKDLNIDGSSLHSIISISGNNRLTVIEIKPETTITLAGVTIKDGYSAMYGGGIYNSGTLKVTNCTFKNNWANRYGGGIYNSDVFTTGYAGTLSVSNSTYLNNSAGSGGGIYHGGSSLDVTNSTFSGNSSYNGGGIYTRRGSARVANSSFFKNTAAYGGGGIYHEANTLKLVNSTFSDNSALVGGALYQSGFLNFSSNILANSSSGGDCYSENVIGIQTNERNLIENNSAWPYQCGVPDFSTDPKLGALANNGGPTQTLALLAGSPAIDAGDNPTCERTDQRGASRPVDGDRDGTATCDIGAFEYRPPSNLKSMAAQDGWLLESREKTNKGGTLNKAASTFFLGDNAQKKQYRSILSFSTKGLPDNAVITRITLKVKKQGIVGGGNPVSLFQGFLVDVKNGFFGSAAGLQVTDFQAGAGKSFGPFKPALSNGWYTIDLTPAKAYLNKLATAGGVTQLRLRFKLDDNNNAVANSLSLYSGNAPVASRPQLIIEYYVP